MQVNNVEKAELIKSLDAINRTLIGKREPKKQTLGINYNVPIMNEMPGIFIDHNPFIICESVTEEIEDTKIQALQFTTKALEVLGYPDYVTIPGDFLNYDFLVEAAAVKDIETYKKHNIPEEQMIFINKKLSFFYGDPATKIFNVYKNTNTFFSSNGSNESLKQVRAEMLTELRNVVGHNNSKDFDLKVELSPSKKFQIRLIYTPLVVGVGKNRKSRAAFKEVLKEFPSALREISMETTSLASKIEGYLSWNQKPDGE